MHIICNIIKSGLKFVAVEDDYFQTLDLGDKQ